MMTDKLGFLLLSCAKSKDLRRGLSLHAAAVKTGILAETFIGNHVLNFYAKCGRIDSAHHMFDEMLHRNLVTWSALISGYDQSNKTHLALRVFRQMHKYFKPNEFVFASALSSCASMKDLYLGQQIHAQALKLSHCYASFVLNSLILVYMKCGVYADALLVFTDSNSEFSTLVSYNIVITGLVENKQQERGIEMFAVMCRKGLIPDRFTFAGLLGPGESIYDLLVIKQLHCQMAKRGLDYTAFSGNVLITLYAKFDLVEESKKAFRMIVERDVVSWNTAITASCHSDNNSKALNLFREMMEDHKVSPDDYTYASVLSAAAGLASMRIGKEIHAHLIRTRLGLDVGVGNALINMYAKSGDISSGYTIFEQMEIHNLVSWNSMIAAFANHGLASKAITLFEEMMRTGLQPDSITFLQLLTACNHCGLANEGQALFNSMSNYRITPSIEHLCCLVDLLGRAGRVTEAEEYTYKHYIGDDEFVLSSLLSAYRLHGGISDGERIAKRLERLHPVNIASPYVLLSNLYASHRKWYGVLEARKLLQGSGLKKEVAYSVIDIKGCIEKFIVGDFSHSRIDEILNLLATLTRTKDEDLLVY